MKCYSLPVWFYVLNLPYWTGVFYLSGLDNLDLLCLVGLLVCALPVDLYSIFSTDFAFWKLSLSASPANGCCPHIYASSWFQILLILLAPAHYDHLRCCMFIPDSFSV